MINLRFLFLFLLLNKPLLCQNFEETEDSFRTLNAELWGNRQMVGDNLRQRLRAENGEEYLRGLVESDFMNNQFAEILTETLPENLEFLGYGLCLQKNGLWESLMFSATRDAFSFKVLINENFAEKSLTKVPISMAIQNAYKRRELSQIFFDAQLALNKGEKSYEELKQEAIRKIETLVNDPEFLADPRFWRPVTSEENVVGIVPGRPAQQKNHVVLEIGGDEAEYQSEEKPYSLQWFSWMLVAFILGGIGVLVWDSRKGSSAS